MGCSVMANTNRRAWPSRKRRRPSPYHNICIGSHEQDDIHTTGTINNPYSNSGYLWKFKPSFVPWRILDDDKNNCIAQTSFHGYNSINQHTRQRLQQHQQQNKQQNNTLHDIDTATNYISVSTAGKQLRKVTRRPGAVKSHLIRPQLPVPVCTLQMALFHIMIVAILNVVVIYGSSPTYSLCYTQLSRADLNGDQIIDTTSTEWGFVVQYISGGTTTADAIDSAALLTTAGSTDATAFNIATVQDPSNNHVFCQALYAAIIAASSIQLDVTQNKCFYAATIGDANRDSSLERYTEFPRYANQVSGNSYGFGTSYEELPLVVQSVFDEFVDDISAGTINIVGSKSSESVTTEQATKLNALCQSTAVAILAANGDIPTPLASPVSVPVPVDVPVIPTSAAPIPSPVADVSPVTTPSVDDNSNSNGNIPDDYVESFTVTDCLLKIAFSDGSRDNALNSDEYYEFINRITDDAFVEYASFDTLPEILRNNFITLAGGTADGTIDVMGSKPGQTPSQEDTDRLNEFCKLTDVAIQGAKDGTNADTSPPVAAPVPDAGTTPSVSNISYEDCVKSMIIADISRDSLLNGKEFVRFMSRLDTTVNPTDDLTALPPAIQSLYTTLATSGGEIDVTGSKPNETPTPEQTAHLERICNEVGTALSASGSDPGSSPSSGSVTINNAFVIANNVQITASMLQPGKPDWETLNKAYGLFITTSVSDLSTNRVRRVRQRLLAITGVLKDSPQLGHIKDAPCPVDALSKDSVCQLVFASFVAEFIDLNETVALATLTNNTQAQINPRLNDTLLSVDPSIKIYIVGPSDEIVLKNNSATKPPKQIAIEEGDDSGGANVVQIIGALVILGILFGGPVYYWKSRRQTNKKPSAVDDVKYEDTAELVDQEAGIERATSLQVKHTFTDEEESEEEDPDIDEDGSSSNDDDDSPTKNDQSGKAGGKKFKPFRLGKKKGLISDDDIGILESNDGLAPGTDDFDDYLFDEPSELFAGENMDAVWGDSNWGVPTSAVADNKKSALIVDDSTPKNAENENEHNEWSHSQSSGSNSAFETGSVISGVSGDNVAQLGGMVDKGQWGGVLQTAAQFHNNLNDSISSHSSDQPSITSHKSFTETSHYDDNPEEVNDELSDDRTPMTKVSVTSEELRRTDMYRQQIEELVRKTAPDEIGNVDSMMEKFVGREAELINTLQTMHDRLVSQRSLKAVHKSKAIRARDIRDFASGGAESSAVIAAACMINSEEDAMDYNQGDFDYEDKDSYYDGDDPEGSVSGSRSYDNENDENYNYDDDNDQSQSDTYDEDDDNHNGSYNDSNKDHYADENHSGRYNDDDYDDDDRSGTGSYDADGQSQRQGGCFNEEDNDPTDYGYNDDGNIEMNDEEEYSQDSEYNDDESNNFGRFGNPEKRDANYGNDYDEDDAFGDEGERFDDEEFDDDFIGSRSDSHTGSYDVKEGSTFASHSGSGSKSHSHSFVYDDGDGSYYSDEEDQT